MAQIRGRICVLDSEILILKTQNKEFKLDINSLNELAPDFSVVECLRVGDLVEVLNGQITLLVPSHREEPFSSEFDRERAILWNNYLQTLRDFFKERDFIELRTPSLVVSPGLEPFLDPFKTQWNLNQKCRDLYLPTSPEFHLKKALTRGFERIFEFKECFRNGELSSTHSPEFLMLEWYRAYEKTESVIEDVSHLLGSLQRKFLPDQPPKEVAVLKMEDLWKDILNFKLTPETKLGELKELGASLDVGKDEKDFDDLFNLIFLEKLEPAIEKLKTPVIIWHYPPSQSALSRLTQEGWADRFEVYWQGLELANAFNELNDYAEQRNRFEIDQQKKKKLGKEVVPVDEELMEALKFGMPPSTGIALGVERLFMALFNLKELSQCRLFSFERTVEKG